MDFILLNKNDWNVSMQNEVSALFKQLNPTIVQRTLKVVLQDDCVLVVCRDGDSIVGMASLAIYKVLSGEKGMIEDVVVDLVYRGKGIGRKLMEKLLDEAKNKGLDEVLLFSGHHRTAAITLYKSLGFQLKDSGLYRLNLN